MTSQMTIVTENDTAAAPGNAQAAAADYTTIRESVGCYQPSGVLVRISGADRLDYLDSIMSKGTEFVEPDQVREVILLADDGAPFAVVTHFEMEEESWLLTQTPTTVEAVEDYFAGAEGAEVEVGPAGWAAFAFEGPAAWRVAEGYVDFDISGLILHQSAPVELDGIEGTHYIARVGTTGEYGYLFLTDAFEPVRLRVSADVVEAGGRPVAESGLARVQAEVGNPLYHNGFSALQVHDADLAWLVDWERIGEFRGSDNLTRPEAGDAKLTPVVLDGDAQIAPGDEVLAGDTAVGTVLFEASPGNADERLAFVRVEAPFWVPGTPLQVGATGATTVSIPRKVAKSTTEKMG